MPIPTACPQCNRQLRVPDNLLGKKVKCPSCGTNFVAESEESAAPPARPSSAGKPPVPPPPPPPDDEEDQEEQDEAPRKSRRRRSESADSPPPGEKPGKVQAIAIMTLVGGILSILMGLSIGLSTCFIWIFAIYSLVLGVMAIIKATKLLGSNAHLEAPPKAIAIMQIINIVNFDVINLVLGILTLIFLGDEEVKNYFQGGK